MCLNAVAIIKKKKRLLILFLTYFFLVLETATARKRNGHAERFLTGERPIAVTIHICH